MLVAVTLIAALGWIFFPFAARPAALALHRHPFSQWRPDSGRLRLAGNHRGAKNAGALRQCLQTGLVLSVAMMCWIMGLQLTTAMGPGAFISSLGVIMAPIMAGVLFHARIARSTWVAALVATVGMACLALQPGMTIHTADLFLPRQRAGLLSSVQPEFAFCRKDSGATADGDSAERCRSGNARHLGCDRVVAGSRFHHDLAVGRHQHPDRHLPAFYLQVSAQDVPAQSRGIHHDARAGVDGNPGLGLAGRTDASAAGRGQRADPVRAGHQPLAFDRALTLLVRHEPRQKMIFCCLFL